MVSQGRYYDGSFHVSQINRIVMGLVSEERLVIESKNSLYEKEYKTHPLKIGVVVHASFIKEAIDALPNLDARSNKAGGLK